MHKEQRISNILFFGFTGLSLFCLLLPLNQLVQTARLLLAYSFYPTILRGHEATEYFHDVPSNFLNLLRADQDNRQLHQELKQLEILKSQMEVVMEENDHYRKILGFAPQISYTGLWARVMGRDPGNWFRSFLVDRGGQDGISSNAPVLGVFEGRVGLLGRVIEVRPNVSKVLLVTDELSSVAAYLKDTRWEGLVEGTGGTRLKMNYLPLDAQIQIGQEVLVSPASVVFPQGLSIGRVFRVLPQDPFLTFQAVEVRPVVSVGQLREVFIIKKH
ncbi:MAG: rod shape-determining protein MreC [Elusimicrobia bacterium]|nr:rod shape-determining protein MreC [Elusimicrobiota bacterium]